MRIDNVSIFSLSVVIISVFFRVGCVMGMMIAGIIVRKIFLFVVRKLFFFFVEIKKI